LSWLGFGVVEFKWTYKVGGAHCFVLRMITDDVNLEFLCMSVCIVAKELELMKCLGFDEVDERFKEITNSSIELNEWCRF